MRAFPGLLTALAGARVRDVRVPGFLDHDRVPHFVPMPDAIYLVLTDGLLQLTAVGNHGGLRLARVAEVAVPAGLVGEEEEFAVGSIGSLLLDAGDDGTPIVRVRYALNGESDAGRGIVRCAELELGTGLRLFLDPSWVSGIRLSAGGGYDDWLRENREREAATFGFVTDHVWAA